MNYRILLLTFALMLVFMHINVGAYAANEYPDAKSRIKSPGDTKYYIDPKKGNDANSGTGKDRPWKTFKQVNRRIFSAGDRITVMGSADFKESLFLIARGTAKKRVELVFEKGDYNFYPENSFKKQFFISNTNDDAYTAKAIAMYIYGSSYVDIKAGFAKMIMRGKMIQTCIDHSQDINLSGLTYDYHRPTVSELEVIKTEDSFADLKIHPDSKYSIKDSLLTWEGEGWRYTPISLWQVLDPATGDLKRLDIKMEGLKYSSNAVNLVRVHFKNNPGFKAGLIYQSRDITRDCAGIFLVRSKNLALKNVHINFMHGMGVVSQFCENVSIDSVFVKPALNSGRTCAAWADILHFSGCKGNIKVTNSNLTAANDDAVNVHGTYLRIVEQPKPNQLLVRFMHSQTFGFEAFLKGDSIALINSKSLLQEGVNLISDVKVLNDKDVLLTLKTPVQEKIEENDVVENVTWTPNVYIANNSISHIPTRGILVTTRRKVMIENNSFDRTHYSAITIANDAGSWFESGMVKDLVIRNNHFNLCSGSVIQIEPENTRNNVEKVHNNITIIGNKFNLRSNDALTIKSTGNVQIVKNSFKVNDAKITANDLIKLNDCKDVLISDNEIGSFKP